MPQTNAVYFVSHCKNAGVLLLLEEGGCEVKFQLNLIQLKNESGLEPSTVQAEHNLLRKQTPQSTTCCRGEGVVLSVWYCWGEGVFRNSHST